MQQTYLAALGCVQAATQRASSSRRSSPPSGSPASETAQQHLLCLFRQTSKHTHEKSQEGMGRADWSDNATASVLPPMLDVSALHDK